MLLILTNSFDATVDLIRQYSPDDLDVFRFNSDLVSDYEIHWTPKHWILRNAVSGLSINSETIKAAYWRKPLEMIRGDLPGITHPYYRGELRYAFREITNWILRNDLFRLVEPFAEQRLGKFQQLQLAQRLFKIPQTAFCFGGAPLHHFAARTIAKSLTGGQVSETSVFYTTVVDTDALDYSKPWFLQEAVEASHDVTCVFVEGWILWSKRDRHNDEQIVDVREIHEPEEWEVFHPPREWAVKVREFMDTANLSFGRLDFLLAKDNELIFLEVNPNGQFGWMDIDNTQGLMDRILTKLRY